MEERVKSEKLLPALVVTSVSPSISIGKMRALARIYSTRLFDKSPAKATHGSGEQMDYLIRQLAAKYKSRLLPSPYKTKESGDGRSSLPGVGACAYSVEPQEDPYQSLKLPPIKHAKRNGMLDDIQFPSTITIPGSKSTKHRAIGISKSPPPLADKKLVEPPVLPSTIRKNYDRFQRQRRVRRAANKSAFDGELLVLKAKEKFVDISSDLMTDKLRRLSQRIDRLCAQPKASREHGSSIAIDYAGKERGKRRVRFALVDQVECL